MASLPLTLLNWDRPIALLGLLILLPLVALMARAVAAARRRRDRFAESQAMGRMAVKSNEGEILVRMAMTVTALALGILALAGPRWGGSLGELLPGESPSLVVTLDVSQSMQADDLEGGRIELARNLLTEVVEGLPGWRIGLIAFADDAQVFCPMTSDTRAVVTLAQRARPGSELKGGSNLEVALGASRELLGKRPGAVLLLTDGEQLAGEALRATKALKDAGAMLVAVGIGTERGGKIQAGTDLFGQPIFRTYQGALVTSRLDERGLKALAAKAGGHYVTGTSDGAAQRVIRLLNERWSGGQTDDPGVGLFVVPLLGCLILLIAEAAWAARRRIATLTFPKVLDAALKRSGHLIVLAALTQIAWTWPWTGALEQAAKSYSGGDYPAAVAAIEQALKSRPNDPRLLYDLGCAHYQGGDFAGAALSFKRALDRLPKDAKLRPWGHYNLGNALFRQSEQAKDSKPLLKAAAKEYEQVLALVPDDDDAKHNLEVVKARLSDKKDGSKPDQPQAGNQSGAGSVPDLPAPDQAEIDATLDALEHDERQRQSESSQAPARTPVTPGELMRQLMRQSPDAAQPDRKDW